MISYDPARPGLKQGKDPTSTPEFTARPRAMDPKLFRNLATGIGQSAEASAVTGAVRKQKVEDAMPGRQRAAVPAAEGFGKISSPQPFCDEEFLDSGFED